MEEIKKGDVVMLKSGGPLMTVTEVGAKCVWFDENKPMKEVFDKAILKIYK
ncbi:MAG TPA: DUF2158 domain-containing protein [Candidatus Aquicultor sp.]|jgi:uncharacterized protein YodC (DUF2158 family)